MKVNPKTTNEEYIHGDFDNDGTANIDDKQPFNKNSKGQVNKEISLSKTIRYVEKKRTKAKKYARELKKKYGFTESRVKDTYSIINKAVRRNPLVSNDLIGLRKTSKNRVTAKKNWQKFNKQAKIPQKRRPILVQYTNEKDNKYESNRNTDNPYRAFHTNYSYKGLGVEAQFNSKPFNEHNYNMHLSYKQGNVTKAKQKQFLRKSKSLIKKGF